MNEIQSVQAIYIIEKGENMIYKKYSKDFKDDKETIEDKVSTLLENYTYTKKQKTEVIAIGGFALIFKVFKDFSISILSEQDSENQVFISEALTALERCLGNVNILYIMYKIYKFIKIMYITLLISRLLEMRSIQIFFL